MHCKAVLSLLLLLDLQILLVSVVVESRGFSKGFSTGLDIFGVATQALSDDHGSTPSEPPPTAPDCRSNGEKGGATTTAENVKGDPLTPANLDELQSTVRNVRGNATLFQDDCSSTTDDPDMTLFCGFVRCCLNDEEMGRADDRSTGKNCFLEYFVNLVLTNTTLQSQVDEKCSGTGTDPSQPDCKFLACIINRADNDTMTVGLNCYNSSYRKITTANTDYPCNSSPEQKAAAPLAASTFTAAILGVGGLNFFFFMCLL